ncbi:sec14 cytosolic factor isoform X1 [Hevea brasiliensis]|uniref:sec14 cytosolic factor isoform X1 n=1 Tax=Hevea brasiliensis TaxID=3981 RepID=UPI0025E95C83|nr:sec14 cytosolic factor isoform X1 [Hevea brasiliensis]
MEFNNGEQPNGEESNEIEQYKVRIMRAHVEREDPSAKEVDDLMIRRFLRARELDVEKASTLFLRYLSWRRSFLPNGFISPSEIPHELAQNKLFMQGVDKKNHPIVVLFGAKHKHYKGNLEEFKRCIVFTLERICERMPTGQEKFVAIADLEGWGYTNSDVRGYIAALSILQDCYPERLAKLFIVHVPYIFMTAWKIIYPFIDSKTKKKVWNVFLFKEYMILIGICLFCSQHVSILLTSLTKFRRCSLKNKLKRALVNIFRISVPRYEYNSTQLSFYLKNLGSAIWIRFLHSERFWVKSSEMCNAFRSCCTTLLQVNLGLPIFFFLFSNLMCSTCLIGVSVCLRFT